MLVRSWQFPSFRRALEFVNQVAALAEKGDHHPDIVLSYRVVRLEVSTHSEGGLTDRDFTLAAEVNALPGDR
jgi:4a-hydroxytetrahydrobiopterin dehydratase